MSSITEKETGVQAERTDSTNTTEQNANQADPKPTHRKRAACLAWSRRFWWLILLILIIVALIIVLPIIYVAVPNIIRSSINSSKLTIQGINVLNTQSSSLQFEINSTIHTSSSYSATVDAFNASFYLEDKLPHTPFTYAEIPKIHVSKTAAINVTQEVQVWNEEAFADFTSWFMLNDTFRVTVDGWTSVHVSGLPSTRVNFKKTVNLTGLNRFEGLNVTQSRVTLLPDSQGDNFFGYITLPNPSVFNVDIGNTSFITLLNTTSIGQSFIDNMFLHPGPNNLSIRANISQLPIIEAVSSEPYCNTGFLPLTFIGENITNSGQELGYFEPAFRENVLELSIDVAADLKPLGLNVSCLA